MILQNTQTQIMGHAFYMDVLTRNSTPMRTVAECETIADETCRLLGKPMAKRVEPAESVSAELLAKRKAGRRCYEAFGRRLAAPNN